MKKKNLIILLIAILTALSFVSCDGLEIGSIVESEVVVAASTGTIADLFSSLYDGETITIPDYVTSEISYTYTDTDGNGEDGTITAGSQIDIKRGIYTFKYTEGSSEKTITALVYSSDNALDMTFGNGTGIGTSDYPYLITSTSDFLKLGNDDVQAKLKDGENHNLYFKLTSDINLSSQNGYVATVFSGTLDGGGHTIQGSTSYGYIFNYVYEDVTFKDFTIALNDNLVRLYRWRAIEKNYTDSKYVYDSSSITLTFDNVDVISNSSNYISIGDNNASVYSLNAPSYILSLDDNGGYEYTGTGGSSDPASIYYDNSGAYSLVDNVLIIKDCDVSGNYIGGFGNSGAAIFTTGQFFDMTVNLDNCTFTSGSDFMGFNVALVVANASSCTSDAGTVINATNVANNGTIRSTRYSEGYTSLCYSNVSSDSNYVTFTVSGSKSEITKGDRVSITTNNNLFAVSSTDSSISGYQVKLFLSTVYWYRDGVYDAVTNSNTMSIELDELGDIGIYSDTKIMSKTEADELSLDLSGCKWASCVCSGASASYTTYTDTSNSNAHYLVIDYLALDHVMRYYNASTAGSLSNFESTKISMVVLIGIASDGAVMDYYTTT